MINIHYYIYTLSYISVRQNDHHLKLLNIIIKPFRAKLSNNLLRIKFMWLTWSFNPFFIEPQCLA